MSTSSEGSLGFPQVEVVVVHGQNGLAEELAAVVLAVGDDAAAQVDEVAAQGQVAVHVDVGAVHGEGGPVLRNLGRRDAGQHALGTGAGGDVGAAAHRVGALSGRVGRDAEPAFQGVGQLLAAGVGVAGHAV